MEKGYRLSAATGLHKGDRPYQQDQVALLYSPRVTGCVLGLVADGMGGRTGGRQASDQVVLTATQLFENYDPAVDDGPSLLRDIAREAHMVIRLTAIAAEQEPHSTLAAFLIHPGGECYWIHSGDSRLFHFRGSQLVRRSKDHSYVQSLIDSGQLSEADAAAHPRANVLVSCLGTQTEPQLETQHIAQLQIGDTVMACSDGLWHYFTEQELGAVLQAMHPREASEFLVEKARQRAQGVGDNLSLVLARVDTLVT